MTEPAKEKPIPVRARLRNHIYLGLLPLLLLFLILLGFSTIVALKFNDSLELSLGKVQAVRADTLEFIRLLSEAEGVMFQLTFFEENSELKTLEQTYTGFLEFKQQLVLSDDEEIATINREFMHEIEAYEAEFSAMLETLRADSRNFRQAIRQLHSSTGKLILSMVEFADKLSQHNVILLGRMARLGRLSVFILSGGMILGVVGTMFAARHLDKLIIAPIESLRNRIDKVAQDNLHIPRIRQSASELEQLEDSFQQLARRLRIFRDLTYKRFLEVTSTFRTVLERFPSPIYFVNREGDIFYSNPAAGRIPSNGRLPPEVIEWLEDQEWSEDVTAQVDPDEAIPIQVEDTTRYFLINHFPLQLIELSENKRHEESRKGGAILLQDVTLTRLSNDLKNNLLETVSHELKTPITSARLALYLLSDEKLGALNEKQADLVVSGKQDLDRLLSTIQNLLDLSRIRSRREPSEMKPVNLNSVVRQTTVKHAEMAETRDIKIELENDRDNRLVKADESRLAIVMNNFLTNAIQHSEANSTIRVVVAARNGHYRVEVIDTGKGIPKHLEKRIFDKFFRASEIVDSGGGIGLHIARDIIEEHGGNIGCTSYPDEGCTFYFELPQFVEES